MVNFNFKGLGVVVNLMVESYFVQHGAVNTGVKAHQCGLSMHKYVFVTAKG